MRKIFAVALFLVLTLSTIFAAGFTIEATVDKNTVEFGESLQLVVTLSQEFSYGRRQNISLPQISNIPGFDIASTRSGQSTSIVNGVGVVKAQMVYELVPQSAGDFVIPAFTFKDQDGNEATSQAIQVKVAPPTPAVTETVANEDGRQENVQSEAGAGRSMFKAFLMLGGILILFIAVPVAYLSYKSGQVGKNTRWDKVEDAVVVEAASGGVAGGVAKVVKPVKVNEGEGRRRREAKGLATENKTSYSSEYKGQTNMDNAELQRKIEEAGMTISKIQKEVKKVLVGQERLVDFLVLALISDGHILLEGVPGLAKTLAIKVLSRTVKTDFSRIQFTPDLLPADLIGTRIFNPKTSEFQTHKGPIFSNFVLADEINRAPAKVQSALLESMEERQVTIEHDTFKLAEPFLVLATQNPIETEGTYRLSEAQVDRFLFKVVVEYPTFDEEREIVKRMGLAEGSHRVEVVEPILEVEEVLALRALTQEIYVDDSIVDYILRVVDATRFPADYGLHLENYIRFGASPRASIYLTRAARTHALMMGRSFVKPDDVKAVMTEVLRHRVIPTYEAEADGVDADAIVETIKQGVEV